MSRAVRGITAGIFASALITAWLYSKDPVILNPAEPPENASGGGEVAETATPTSAINSSGTSASPTPSGETPRALSELLASAEKSLPDSQIFQGRPPESVHDTPLEVMDAGEQFGNLAEYLEKHPEAVPAALPTYVSCALNSKTVESLRALCTYRLELYEKSWDAKTRSSFTKIPPAIRKLADRLKD